MVSFLQTLREGKINERGILALNLALEAVLDESKTALTEEFLLGILRLVEACCTKAETEKTQQEEGSHFGEAISHDKVWQFLPLCN